MLLSIAAKRGARLSAACGAFPFRSSRWASTLASIYQRKVEDGTLQADDHQRKLVKLLDKLKSNIECFPFHNFEVLGDDDRTSEVVSSQAQATNSVHPPSSSQDTATTATSMPRLRGVYIFGSVGAGKTMLMDLFFESCSLSRKRRVHFHQFMLEVHQRIHRHKQTLLQAYGQSRHVILHESHNSIAHVAREISREAHLLCFDEFQVTDICDAVIITRLFGEMWKNGTVVVATSNRAPSELYKNGLNRHDFLPFIDRLEQECIVRSLDNDIDYRTTKSASADSLSYYTPCNAETLASLQARYLHDLQAYRQSASLHTITPPSLSPATLHLAAGRTLQLVACAEEEGFCMVHFDTLCREDRGAVDYHTLAQRFHSIYLLGVPQQNKHDHNTARRFITLIDELYNARIRLVWVAATPPAQLFVDEGEVGEVEESEDKVLETTPLGRYPRAYQQPHVRWTQKEEKKQNFGQQEELSVVVGELASVQELSFAFRRAASRLTEMASEAYFHEWREKVERKVENQAGSV